MNEPDDGWESFRLHKPDIDGNGESKPILCYIPQSGSLFLCRVEIHDDKYVFTLGGEVMRIHDDFFIMWKYAPYPSQSQIEKHLERMSLIDD